MTETSSGSTQHSPDTINVLPILSEAKADQRLTKLEGEVFNIRGDIVRRLERIERKIDEQ
jgi:hypothetical protein